MARGIRIMLVVAVLGALGAAAGAAVGSNGPSATHETHGLRLVANTTSRGLTVRAIGAGKVTFSITGGPRRVRVSSSSVRIDGASLTGSGPSLRLVARATGSGARMA